MYGKFIDKMFNMHRFTGKTFVEQGLQFLDEAPGTSTNAFKNFGKLNPEPHLKAYLKTESEDQCIKH